MTLQIDTIKKPKGNKAAGKRVGRGNSSGRGTYSGRGLKGQKSRAGVSRLALKKIGMKHGRSSLRNIPKLRGFKSLKPSNQVVKIEEINKYFKVGEVINPKTLLAKKMISNAKQPVKILGGAELKVENVTFENVKLSKALTDKLQNTSNKK